jgi:ABC-type nitrate/sulfonate/bicarbonate transport system substrate-binding protein
MTRSTPPGPKGRRRRFWRRSVIVKSTIPDRARRVASARLAWPAIVLVAAVGVGCTGDSTASPSTPPTTAPTASPSGSAAPPSAGPSESPAEGTETVRFALDWVPNTNHTGIYVASTRGWYEEAGVDLQVLPYAGTTPEALMTGGQAECGISFQDALTFAAAAGAPVVSVMAILQRTASTLAVLSSSAIDRPREMDGRTYAGFGYPNEEPTVRFVIEADGGTGQFTTVLADTAAYEALYAGRADMTIVFSAWEGIAAARSGIALRQFQFSDYGFPEFYQVVLACDGRWLTREPDLARAFLGATVRGYEVAAAEPEAAVDDLIDENPEVFEGDPGLPLASQLFLAQGDYLVDGAGAVGTQTLERWTAYSTFLFDQGLLAGPDGQPLDVAPDYAALFTNDYLPAPPAS